MDFFWYVLNSEERAHKTIRHREQLLIFFPIPLMKYSSFFNKLKPEFISSNSERVLGTKSNDLLRSKGDFAVRLMEDSNDLLRSKGDFAVRLMEDITASLSDQINLEEAFQIREKRFSMRRN